MTNPAPTGAGALEVEALDGFESAREDWDRLAQAGGNVFGTWEWASTWWRHFRGSGELRLAACRNDAGERIAIVPLFLASSRPLRVLRLVGRGLADQLDPICDPSDRPAVAAALRSCLDAVEPGWSVFVAENLPSERKWTELAGATTLSRLPNPVLHIEGESWDDYFASRSAKFRQQVRRNERRLERDHGLAYRDSDDPDRLDEDLDILFGLHGSRWGGESSGVFAGAGADFHREFAALAQRRGWLRLRFLELEGRAVAARYGFRYAGTDFQYQTGRDPEWDRYGVGFLLQVRSIRQAFEAGMREYRMLRGGEAYKGRFTDDQYELETAVLSRGFGGRAALIARQAALRAQSRSRRWRAWRGES